MSEEEKKNKKKKAAIIAGIVVAAALIGGATGGIIADTETETKEEENDEEKKKKPICSVKKVPNTEPIDTKQDLSTLLSSWNPIIVTNGALQPTVTQIQTELTKKGIDTSQVDITVNSATKAKVSAKTGATAKYKGNAVTVTFTVDKKVELGTALPQTQRNLGTIVTNGALQPTVTQIQTELTKKGIDTSQVDITVNSATKAKVSAKTGATAKYKGNAVTVTFTVDKKVELGTALPQTQRNLGTIVTNGALQPTVTQIQTELTKKGIDTSQVDITVNSATKAKVSAKTGATAKYKGNAVTVTFTVDKKVELGTALPQTQRNLGTIVTNGALQPTVTQIQTELTKKGIDTSQVDITVNSATQAKVSAKTGATAKYKGNAVTVTFTVDKKVELGTALPQTQRNLGTIVTNGALQPTVTQIQTELTKKGIDTSQVDITVNSATKAKVSAKTGATAKYKGNAVTVTFTVDKKVELGTALPQTQRNLGTIVTNGALQPTVTQIQTELTKKGIDTSQVDITVNSATKAKVSAKTGATAKYKGNAVTVTFTVDKKVELGTALPQTQRNLGTIVTNGALQPTVTQIQTELTKKGIDTSQVDITVNSATQAKVSAKTGATAKYKGNAVTVTFTVDKKVELGTALPQTQRNLGTIVTNGALQPTVTQIQTELTKKGIDTSQVDITVNSATKAKVSAKTGATAKYKGNAVTVTFTVDKKVELGTALPQTQRNLGTIVTNGALQPTVTQIQTELTKKGIDTSQVDITVNSATQAKVSAKTGATAKYKGNAVTVTFTVDKKVELGTALPQTQRNLGTIVTNGALQPTVTQIQTELTKKGIDTSQVDITVNSATKAKVSAKTGATAKYKGNAVTVTFTVDKKVELGTALPQTQRNLGTIVTNGALQPTVTQIQTELTKKGIDTSQVDITVNSATKAKVSAKTGATAKYKGNAVTVTFTVDKKVELGTALPQTQRNLGTIVTNGALQPTVTQIQTELTKKGIDTSQVDITVNSATKAKVSAKTGATAKYKGNAVTVTFTVDKKVELGTALPQTQRNLGTIVTNGALQPTVTQIQTELTKKGIDTSQVDITVNSATKAKVSAKTGATAKYKGNAVTVTFTVDKKVELNNIGDSVWSLAIGQDGSVYAGTRNGKIYKNGQEIMYIKSAIWSLVIGQDGSVYAGTRNGKIYKNGQEIMDIKVQVTSLAIGQDGSVYTGTRNGKIYKNGQEIMDINIAIREIIIKDNNDVYSVTITGKIYKNKQEIYNLGLQITSSTTNKNGSVYTGDNQGKIYKIDITQSIPSKTEIYTVASSQVTSLAIGQDGSVYAGTQNGKIYKLGIL